MKHKSKLFLSILLTAILFSLSACGAINYYNICNSAVNATKHSGEMGTVHNASYTYLTFEEAVTEFATDVVIAQYVGSRPFGNHSTEFEFIVLDRILGNAPERIFVYTLNNLSAHVSGGEYDAEIPFNPGELSFDYGLTYLLPLMDASSPYALTEDAAFRFIRDAVVVLDAPELSVMYSEPLEFHMTSMDLSSRTSVEELNTLLMYLVEDNVPSSREFASLTTMEDIILNSPNVLVVDIGEPFSLAKEQAITDFMLTDIYRVSVAQVLKGGAYVCANNYRDVIVVFPADTVFSGERHIVATRSLDDEDLWHEFTTRYSLFPMSQLETITNLLEKTGAVQPPDVLTVTYSVERYDYAVRDEYPIMEIQPTNEPIQPSSPLVWASYPGGVPGQNRMPIIGFWQNTGSNRITVTAERQTVAQTSHLFNFHTRVEEARVKWGNALGGVSIQRVSNHNLANIRLHVGTRTQMSALIRELGTYCGISSYCWTVAGWLSFPLVGTRQIGRLTRAVAVHVAGTGASTTLARARNFVAHELGHTLGFDGHSSNSTFVMHNWIVGNTVIRSNEAMHLRQIYDRFRPRHVASNNTFVNYSAHVENLGWMAQVNNSAIGGTVGQSLRMEAIRIFLSNVQTTGGIQYRVNV